MRSSRARPDRVPHVICDGCGADCEMMMVSDTSDPDNGLLVNENFFGHCPNCQYEFLLTVQLQEQVDLDESDLPF